MYRRSTFFSTVESVSSSSCVLSGTVGCALPPSALAAASITSPSGMVDCAAAPPLGTPRRAQNLGGCALSEARHGGAGRSARRLRLFGVHATLFWTRSLASPVRRVTHTHVLRTLGSPTSSRHKTRR
eukprot:4986405-Prymnesium_polylepis.1